MSSNLYFISLPFHGSPEQKKERTDLSASIAAQFLKAGVHVFAPINYVNSIAEKCEFDSLNQRREKIMPWILEFLRVSKALVLIKVDGYQDSWGVAQELEFCRDNHIPIIEVKADEVYDLNVRGLMDAT